VAESAAFAGKSCSSGKRGPAGRKGSNESKEPTPRAIGNEVGKGLQHQRGQASLEELMGGKKTDGQGLRQHQIGRRGLHSVFSFTVLRKT